ncbi:hypothetical protein BC829DRAFT_226886 [Chytridium lagenaria]|nr:hypothetical protein BC829DRAFT_226886 [Chytridium lagenaria]
MGVWVTGTGREWKTMQPMKIKNLTMTTLRCFNKQKALEAWRLGVKTSEDLHCLKRIADYHASEERLEKASILWEKASSKGDITCAKSLVRFTEMKRAAGEMDQDIVVDDDEDGIQVPEPDSPTTRARKHLKYAEMAASTGDPTHITLIATLHHHGLTLGTAQVLPRNPLLAVDLYMKAHEAGSASSIVNAANILMEGDEGVPKDIGRAMELYATAARDGGNQHGAGTLVAVGDAYAEGIVGVEDFGKAFEYYAEAEALGDAKAAWKMGDCYRDGMDVPKTPSRRLRCTRKLPTLTILTP